MRSRSRSDWGGRTGIADERTTQVGTRIASALRAGRSTNLNILPESMALQLSRRGTHGDRLFFVQLYRWFPSILPVLQIVRPETLIRWRRAGFRSYWRWTSRNRRGRSQIDMDLRALIGQMSLDLVFCTDRGSCGSREIPRILISAVSAFRGRYAGETNSLGRRTVRLSSDIGN
jgi:hypothetical protein